MTIDCVDGELGARICHDPTWSLVEAALRSLNGDDRSMVILDNEMDAVIYVAGDIDVGLFISLSIGSTNVIAKFNDTPGTVELKIGGQEEDYRRGNLCSLSSAGRIVKMFIGHDVGISNITWETAEGESIEIDGCRMSVRSR